jgi:DNA adenine methylase
MGNVHASAFRSVGGAAPILKWAGGKQWLVAKLIRFVPRTAAYFEPFLGGGSLFFAAAPKRSFLSDTNPDLIETYQTIREDPLRVIEQLTTWRYDEATYYLVRSMRLPSSVGRAARFIYLNRTCWNGLYRVNRENRFNVPFGRFSNPTICNSVALIAASKALSKAKLSVCDFERAVKKAKKGDFVYLDPPYTVKHSNNGFLRYNEHLFTWTDQERLSTVAKDLRRRGCLVLVSNAPHETLTALYRGFHTTNVSRLSNLAGDRASRGAETEVLISSFRLPGF